MDWVPLVRDLCEALDSEPIPTGIEKEEDFERKFVEPVVRRVIDGYEAKDKLEISSHPWVKKGVEVTSLQIDRSKSWRSSKKWANVTAWGMKHTLDMFIRDVSLKDAVHVDRPQDCIAVEVKFCKVKSGRLPGGEFQRMIGQSVLFRSMQGHKAVIAVFGFRGPEPADFSDNGAGDFLRGIGVWPVVRRVP